MRARGFSPRRRVLLGVVLLMMVLMLVLRALGVAGFNETGVREMDWNGDGVVGRAEIAQGYTIIAVREDVDGNRVCRRYVRLRAPDAPLRVDCKVEFKPASGD